MNTTFTDVMWIVCGLGIVAALYSLGGASKQWEAYTKRGLFMESAQGDRQGQVSVNSREVERLEEIRQLVEAANNRRRRRGELPVDVDAEIARLTAESVLEDPPPVDPEIEAEVRHLVALRNERRARRGERPLDAEAEVARELAALRALSPQP